MNVHPFPARFLASLALALSLASTSAQVTSTTAGEIAVRSNENAANLATNPGDDIAILFDFDVLGAAALGAPSADHVLSQGKYLVLYSTRWDHSGGQQRAEVNTRLTLEPAGGGAAVDLKYGTAQGFIRTASGANEAVVSGGTIVEAAATGDILRLHGTRTDENATSVKNLRGTGLSSIQFLKLDDSWDTLRVSRTSDTAAATNANFTSVSYEIEDESSLGAMSLTDGSDITFIQAGRYLVMANTSLLSTNLGSTGRTGYRQQLTLDGTPVAGSTTTTYVRGNPNADGCHNGVLAIGTIIQATAGQVLNVQTSKEQGLNCTITSAGTGLAIVQLPATGSYISRSDTTGQNLNTAGAGASVTFGTSIGSTGSAFAHSSGSVVTVNKTGTYLFLSGFFCLDDTADRQVPWQTWKVNGTTAYGGSARYSRNNQIDQNGNWSGFLASLTATDTVEVNSQALAAGGVVAGNDLALQGVHIESLFPSDDPIIVTNLSLSAVVNSLGNVIDEDLLRTIDNNTADTGLIYTIDTVPTGGTVKLSGAPLAVGGTFTQDDVNNDRVTFDAGAAAVNGGFDFTVSDGGAGPASETFAINVGLATSSVADAGTTDEDTGATEADLTTGANLLANDAGSSLVVTGFDATSANGAAVTVSGTGTFTYDPTGSAALQALAVGESIMDTFDYTVTDVFGAMTSETVTITVDGVNDVPVVVAESHRSLGGPTTNNLLANDSDVDGPDSLTVSNFDAAGNGGAVPVPGPLGFTSAQGATVSISSNGAFSYDPSTSAAILALADGATLTETFSYDVFDGTSAVATTVMVTSAGTVGASNDLAAVAGNATVSINALANDSRYSGAVGLPTAGAELEFLADGVGNTSAAWLNTGAATLASIPQGGTALIDATHNLAPLNPLPGMAATYDFAGIEGIEHDGFDAGPYGQSDQVNASIEFLFRPSDQVGNEVLLDVGGTTDGSSICLVGNLVVWTAGDNGSQAAQAVAVLPPGAVAGGEWVHVVCTIDLATDNAEIWLNGVLADSNAAVNVNNGAAGNLADWCGTDPGGIGRRQTDVGGDLGGLGNFGTTDLGVQTDYAGEVALLRTYESLLSSAEVMANFQALVGATVGSPTAGDVTDLNGTASPIPGTTVVVLASGATVAFELDGSFTYDPNGAFDALAVGLTAKDSFTYTIDNHHNATTTAHIIVSGTNASPQVAINQDGAQADPALVGPINFEVIFSEDVQGFGAEASDVDLSASTAAGTLTAVVTGGPTTYNVAISGMTGSGFVIASIPAGAAQRLVTLEENLVSSSTDNSVEYIENVSPVASNLVQALSLTVINPGTMAQLDDIVVSDSNHVTSSTLNTATGAHMDHPAVDAAVSFVGVDPSDGLGASWEVLFTPSAADVAIGGVGTENRRMLVNWGGSSNGSGIYLIEGIPYFIAKMNTNAAASDATLNDVDWAPEGMVNVPLTASPLTGGISNKIAVIFSLDNLRHSVNGSAAVDTALTNRGGKTNWAGDNSVRIGTLGGPGGLSNNAGSLFFEGAFLAFGGTFDYARLFNLSDGTVSIDAVDLPETITATISINGYVDDGTSGTLSAATGNGETYSAGVWTITALLDAVNMALADVKFTFGTAAPPATMGLTIEDGNEDGSAALAGEVVINTIIRQWRSDNFAGDASNTGNGANGADPDSDSVINLLEFAFGTDPNVSDNNPLTVTSATTFTPGGPTTVVTFSPLTITYRFVRRVDHVAAGLTYTPQFTADGVSFLDSGDVPTVVVADDGSGYEVVEVPFLVFLPNGTKASDALARVQVTLD